MNEQSLQEILDESVHLEGDEPVFEEAWQARIFSLAVAMRGEEFEWKDFQQRLADEIDAAETPSAPDQLEEDYYQHWMRALEGLLVESGHVDHARLQRRAKEFSDGDRTAAEFVEGDHEAAHHHDESHHHDHD